MAGNKGRAVGKLFSAGAALMQHRRCINDLRTTPPEQVRSRLVAYLEGVSSLSRAGFQATLAGMIKTEKTEAGKAFLQSLVTPVHEVLEELRVSDQEALASAPAVATAASSRSGPAASFDDDLRLVHSWMPLSPGDRRDAVAAHVRPLPVEHHETFVEHARAMFENIKADICRHEEEEDSAWGGFIEDRIAYLNARLVTGQRDPRWVEQREQLQAFAELFDEVATVAGEALAARADDAAPAAAAPGAGPTADVEELEALLDQFTETGVMPDGLMEKLGRIDDPAVIDRLLGRLKAAGADELSSRPLLEIADYYVDGSEPYALWWPLAGPGLSLPVPFEELPRETQFHVLWAEFSFRLTEASALRNAGKLDEAQEAFQECVERASQLDVSVLKEQSYEGLMTVAERRGDRVAAQRYLNLARLEHLRTTR